MQQLTARQLAGAAATLLALALSLAGCSSSSGSVAPETSSARPEAGPPAALMSAGLQDSVVPQAGGMVSWTTTWRACFAPGDDDDEVVAWQAQALTSEGSSPQVDEVTDGCIDLDVATGVNTAEAGMRGRDIQLSDAQSLAYRVRAIHSDGSVTPWTEPVRVGTEMPAG